MENKLLALVAALAMAALPAATQADGKYYVGGGIGLSSLKIDNGDFSTTSRSESDLGYKLVGGYKFSRYLSVEAGFVSFGTAKNKYTVNGNPASLEAKATGFFAAGKASLPISEELAVFGRLGISRNHSSASISDPSLAIQASGSKIVPMIGLGVQYDFGRTWNWSAVFEYDFFGKTANDLRTGLVSANLLYSFN